MRKEEKRYEKGQLVRSQRYRDQRDLVEALLIPGKGYTLREVDAALAKYRKGKVK